MARKTKDEAEQTRERILDAAEHEMLACGVGQASLARIAARANVTRGAIYWHFEDKSALLEAMVARTKLPLRDLRRCLVEHSPDVSPFDLMREMILHGVNRLANDTQHRRVCHIVLHRCETDIGQLGSSRLLKAMFEESRSVLVSICHEISAIRLPRAPLSPEDASDVILAYIVGLYQCSLRYADTYAVDREAGAKIDAMLDGLFPPPATDVGPCQRKSCGRREID